ncbi:hypothetical protein BJ165DRAFT_1518018, partial [Panaeolus papilionaceus]
MSYFHTRYDIVLRLFLPLLCLSCVWFSFRGSQPSPSRLWVLIIVERRTQSPPLRLGRCSFYISPHFVSIPPTDRPETCFLSLPPSWPPASSGLHPNSIPPPPLHTPRFSYLRTATPLSAFQPRFL